VFTAAPKGRVRGRALALVVPSAGGILPTLCICRCAKVGYETARRPNSSRSPDYRIHEDTHDLGEVDLSHETAHKYHRFLIQQIVRMLSIGGRVRGSGECERER
jgi:hypothetical protein